MAMFKSNSEKVVLRNNIFVEKVQKVQEEEEEYEGQEEETKEQQEPPQWVGKQQQ